MVRPKKHLGQHFLTDKNIARNIVNLVSEKPAGLIEIGAGTGILTELLLKKFAENFYVVEIDAESIDYLKLHFPELDDRLLHQDFLQCNLSDFPSPLSVIGNFPYNIGSQIFFHILRYKDQVSEIVCMIQKEVAERIASPPGNKTYGILSVLLQAWYSIELEFTVNEKVFNPPPKVKSTVIRLKRNNIQNLDCDEAFFVQLVKKGFNQRRKTLRNALREYLKPETALHPLLDKRAEQLSVNDFVMLTRLLHANLKA